MRFKDAICVRDRWRRIYRLSRGAASARRYRGPWSSILTNLPTQRVFILFPQASGHNRYRFAQADICDGPALRQLLRSVSPTIRNKSCSRKSCRSFDRSTPPNLSRPISWVPITLLQAARRYWNCLKRTARPQFRFHHISTDEVFGTLGPEGLFTEASAICAKLTLFGIQSLVGSSRASMASDLRPADARHQLLEQLRSLSVSGKAHSPHDYQEPRSSEPLPVYGDGRMSAIGFMSEDHAER